VDKLVLMAGNTPDSELGSIECFQNYTAPEVFIQGLAGIVDQQDVESMLRAQKQMLQRFEKTNEMLANCNTLCVTRLRTASVEFKKHTQLLVEMKKDLDNIFRRIQTLKSKTHAHYPEAYAAVPQMSREVKSEAAQEEAMKVEKDVDNTSSPPEELSAPTSNELSAPKEDLQTPFKRGNSSSSDSPSHNDSSSYSSDTG